MTNYFPAKPLWYDLKCEEFIPLNQVKYHKTHPFVKAIQFGRFGEGTTDIQDPEAKPFATTLDLEWPTDASGRRPDVKSWAFIEHTKRSAAGELPVDPADEIIITRKALGEKLTLAEEETVAKYSPPEGRRK